MTEQMQVPFVDLKHQTRQLRSEIEEAIQRVLDECDFILGAAVDEFEKRFAEFVGVAHAVGVSSGLDALRLSLQALDIGEGDEVIVPANTYIASALAVSAVGARPKLIDCDPTTWTIDVDQLEDAIGPRTRAVMAVHLTGQPVCMDRLFETLEGHSLYVIEDAAQAHGALWRQKRCGSIGDVGCFSFYPSKNLGALGDGGIVTTDAAGLAHRIRRLRNYGQGLKNRHKEKGLNARLDTLQAAVLNVKLSYLDEWNARRRHAAAKYMLGLGDLPQVNLQLVEQNATSVYHLFMLATKRRDALQRHLAEKGIQTGIHYPIPLHLQDAYSDLGHRKGDFPVAERLSTQLLSLPMFPGITDGQLDYVISSVKEFYE